MKKHISYICSKAFMTKSFDWKEHREKCGDLNEIFGTLKFRKSTQQMMEEIDEGNHEDG